MLNDSMLCDWTAECSPDAPTLVVPWSDAETGLQFIDLRANPYDIAEISEVEHNPALGRALRALNATRSPLITAKCDAWSVVAREDPESVEPLRLELFLEPELATHGYASYIDFLWRERSLYASAHQQQDRLDRLVRRVQKLDHPEVALQLVLRPSVYDGSITLEGFSVTMYLTALGPDHATSIHRWEYALEDIVNLLRAKDLEIARGAATIDETP